VTLSSGQVALFRHESRSIFLLARPLCVTQSYIMISRSFRS